MPKPEHLGDGAYISETPAGVVLTANHHDPEQATDAVYVEEQDVPKLIAWLKMYDNRG